jgi:hypothetical protein
MFFLPYVFLLIEIVLQQQPMAARLPRSKDETNKNRLHRTQRINRLLPRRSLPVKKAIFQVKKNPLKKNQRATHTILSDLLKFGDCKFIRPLGLNGSKYDQRLNLASSPSKYSMIARPVLQALAREQTQPEGYQPINSQNDKTLSIQFLVNFFPNKKNDEVNQKVLQTFDGIIGR